MAPVFQFGTPLILTEVLQGLLSIVTDLHWAPAVYSRRAIQYRCLKHVV